MISGMDSNQYNCILIPGGGLLEDGSLPGWTVARLDAALSLQRSTDWIITLSGGTVHKPPPLDQQGYPVFESRKAAEYLASSGVDPRRILSETCSYDTIGNAYFSRMLFADPLALKDCLIITSDFHMARTKAAFLWIYSLTPQKTNFNLSFQSTPDRGLSPPALIARRERERRSLANLNLLMEKIAALAAFQRWLYREHAAYAIDRSKDSLTDDELKSY